MPTQSAYLINVLNCLEHPAHGGMTPYVSTEGLSVDVEDDDQDTEFYHRILLSYHICSHQILPHLLREMGETSVAAKLSAMTAFPHLDSAQSALNYLVASRPILAQACAWHNFTSINKQHLFENGDWRRLGFCLKVILRMNDILIDYLAADPKARMLGYASLVEALASETASVFSASCLTDQALLCYWKRLVGESSI